jgi:hypothetical protein
MAVQCLECIATTGSSKEFKTLVSHLYKHVLSVADYRAKYGDEVEIGYSVNNNPKVIAMNTASAAGTKSVAQSVEDILDSIEIPDLDPNDVVTASMDTTERKFFQSRYDFLMRSAEDDRALESQIRDIVMGEITLMRYQKELAKITGALGSPMGLKRLPDAKALQTLIKELRQSNLSDIKSLNLTREQKQAQRKSPETTPSRLMSRYSQYMAALNPDLLSRAREDELEAASRFWSNLKRLLELVPQDAVPSEEAILEEEEFDEDSDD